jgi:hypothetical protein
MVKTQIIFAEFGGRFSPDVGNVRKYFRDSDIQVYGVENCEDLFHGHPRWGNLMNDYWKVKKLIDADGYDVAIAMDADTKIVSDRVKTIFPLVKKFGLCLPANPRKLVKVDTEIGAGSDKRLDETLGMGYAFNMTPIAVDRHNLFAMDTLKVYCDILKTMPVRGPLAMWRAVYYTGFFPCLLPPQWCVCAEDIGITNEVILHIGHDKVREIYG